MIHNLIYFFPLTANLILGFLVLLKNKRSNLNRIFFLLMISISCWIFSLYLLYFHHGEHLLFIGRLNFAFTLMIAYFGFLFGYIFPRKTFNIKKYVHAVLLVFSSLFIYATLFTPLVCKDEKIINGEIITEFGPLFPLYITYFFVFSLCIVLLPLAKFKHLSVLEKHHVNYLLVGVLLSIVFAGATNIFLPYIFQNYKFQHLGPMATLGLAGFTTYSIVIYRLMDIKFVLRKWTVLCLSLFTLIILVVVFKYFFNFYFQGYDGWNNFVILMVGVIVYPGLKKYYYHLANKYFFSSLYDSGEIISRLSEDLKSTIDVERIYGFLYGALNRSIHMKEFVFFKLTEKEDVYRFEYCRGTISCNKPEILIDYPGCRESINRRKAVIISEIKNKDENESIKIIKNNFEIIVPLGINNKLIGIMAVGRKESGDSYSSDDIEFLELVASQAAISIENALLYRKNLELNVKLEKEVQEATRELKSVNKKLMKLDQAKSEFMSIASHQLRTPLTVIKGYTSMMLEKNFGEMNDKQIEPLMKVYDSNERLIQLVENLLNISRIESGGQEYYFENVSLKNLLDGVVEELSGLAKKKNLEIIYEADGKLPNIKADEEKIRQVALNLIENALKYTNQGKVRISLEKKAGEAIFSVSDKGVGITKKDMPKLFKKFSRGTSSSMSHIQGTGLGLYVAKSIVEAHKGKLWAESKGEGRGSTFYFTLPLIKKTYEEKNPHSRGRGILTRHVQDQVRKGGL